MKAASRQKRVFIFFRKNYIITIFIACILFVGVVVVARAFLSKPTYIYVKVKVGQGLWWATTAKPPIWMVNAIKKGDVAVDLLGKPTAEILSKRYYRYYGSDQFDVYLTMKLKVSGNKRTGTYSFDRSTLSVGTPIEIQFPNEVVTGTVIELSQKSLNKKLIEKTITVTKKYAYPWEFVAISVGDSYFDGEDKIFEVLDKETNGSVFLLSYSNAYSTTGANVVEPSNYVTVKAKVKMQQVDGQWVLGEDQLIVPGRNLSISTSNFVFDNYIVSNIE